MYVGRAKINTCKHGTGKIPIFAGYLNFRTMANKPLKGLINKTLSDRERAAIYMHVYGGCDNWQLLYSIAQPGELDRPFIDTQVSTWKNSAKIKGLIRDLTAAKGAQEDEIRKAGYNAGQNDLLDAAGANDAVAGVVDYTKPEEQKKLLNRLIATATEPGEAIDALKIIVAGQKDDRQAAREGRQVRAYLPLLFYQCPLYVEKRKNIDIL